MKVIVQRVKESSVKVHNKIIGKSAYGYLLLVAFTQNDDDKIIDYMVQKIINLRIIDDDEGIMNKNILDIKGSVLSISQFTLYGDTSKGNRPSYVKALNGNLAIKLYDKFNEELNKYVQTLPGIFGADMQVSILNDGPVTIVMEV